jgi:beta-lactam-binding protein with PASTA domain
VLGNERDLVIMDCGDEVGHVTAQSPGSGTAVPVGWSVSFDFGVMPSGNYHCW